MTGICEGRVAIVTGAGRGIGRGYAVELARQGARVVVNDLGSHLDGAGSSNDPAQEVVDEIRAFGGEAIANGDDVSDWDGAGRLVRTAVDRFGGLDVLVNNAGIIRDRMLVNMSIDEWDAVIRVHLRGTFAPTRHAAGYWRGRSKAGESNNARIINTTSTSGIYGRIAQTNYGAAKAGIAAFTIIAAKELEQYGVTVNAIAPGGRTRMTEDLQKYRAELPGPGEFDTHSPDNVAPVVAWLASTESAAITGRVFHAAGGRIDVPEGWRAGPLAEKDGRWDPAELGPIVSDLAARATPNADTSGKIPSTA